ncbi:hypothetical protein [Georhizobium sp. MAB10]|uniref:head-tail joining protein n=1 Tax=Georhizobium sp. MAB10 TaxID=3028319 RepID=UPI0038559054
MIPPRPTVFDGMGAAITAAFGNVDAVFTIDGVSQPAVRALLRQRRDIDLGDEGGQAIEGTRHTLAVDARLLAVPPVTGRDSVTISGITYRIGNRLDDGRAMLRFILDGDI